VLQVENSLRRWTTDVFGLDPSPLPIRDSFSTLTKNATDWRRSPPIAGTGLSSSIWIPNRAKACANTSGSPPTPRMSVRLIGLRTALRGKSL